LPSGRRRSACFSAFRGEAGRGDRIRTCDPQTPSLMVKFYYDMRQTP
jgi:hypothetical protein